MTMPPTPRCAALQPCRRRLEGRTPCSWSEVVERGFGGGCLRAARRKARSRSARFETRWARCGATALTSRVEWPAAGGGSGAAGGRGGGGRARRCGGRGGGRLQAEGDQPAADREQARCEEGHEKPAPLQNHVFTTF